MFPWRRLGNRAAANQPPPLVGHNVVTSDVALVEAVTRHGSPEVVDDLTALGHEAGTAEAREHGMLANTHKPELTPYDRFGNRIDEVVFHPSWHWLMARAVGHGLQAAPWERADAGDAHAHVRRAAGFLAWSQTEPGPRLPHLDDLRGRAQPSAPTTPSPRSGSRRWPPRRTTPASDPSSTRPAHWPGWA